MQRCQLKSGISTNSIGENLLSFTVVEIQIVMLGFAELTPTYGPQRLELKKSDFVHGY